MSLAYVHDRAPGGWFSLTESSKDYPRCLRAVLPLVETHASGAEVFHAMLSDEERLWVFRSVWRETVKRKPKPALSLFGGNP